MLCAHREAEWFLPASNQKLLTAIAAFEILGPDYRLETRVVTNGLLAGGVLDGDVFLVGLCDPAIVDLVVRATADSWPGNNAYISSGLLR